MPYKNPKSQEARLSRQRANRKFAELHPEVVKKAKQDWYEANKESESERIRQWKLDNPEKEFAGHIRRKFGLTLEQYNAFLQKQSGRCAICRGPVVGKKRKRFDIDHNHQTKEVRGLLCHPCNVMLGQAMDTPERLEAGAIYLRERGYANAGAIPSPSVG